MIDLAKTQLQFLKNLESSGKSFNTVKNYRADLEAFNKFLVLKKRPMTLKSFSATEAQEYASYLENLYGSPNSIRRRVQALRLFFDFLVTKHSYPDNPIKLMPVAPKLLEKPDPASFKDLVKIKDFLIKKIETTEGLEKLMGFRNLFVFAIIYESGVKVSDLARLERADLIGERKSFRVLIRPEKREAYSVPLSGSLFDLWQTYQTALLSEWPYENKPTFALFNANPYKILSGSLSPRGTELFFEEVRRATKLTLSARSLRQACVFRWMNLQSSESQIKEWLGVAPDYDISLYNEVFQTKKPLYLDLTYA
jgi:site-specific recombinase XerD